MATVAWPTQQAPRPPACCARSLLADRGAWAGQGQGRQAAAGMSAGRRHATGSGLYLPHSLAISMLPHPSPIPHTLWEGLHCTLHWRLKALHFTVTGCDQATRYGGDCLCLCPQAHSCYFYRMLVRMHVFNHSTNPTNPSCALCHCPDISVTAFITAFMAAQALPPIHSCACCMRAAIVRLYSTHAPPRPLEGSISAGSKWPCCWPGRGSEAL